MRWNALIIGSIAVLVACALATWFSLRRSRRRRTVQNQQTTPPNTVTFGFQEEWQDFERRNRPFLERFPRLEKTLQMAFGRDAKLGEPIDKFILMFGRVCVEDFLEVLLCCGNGNGQAAQKLLRGLYERAVTLRYLHEHPEEIDDFLDFYHVTQRKLMIACQSTMGADTFPPEMAAEIEREYQ
jgi:hypothetical protein